MEFEEGKYGMLMMVLCDREGRIYDVLVYVYAYAIGYSYYRRGELEVLFLTQRMI